MRPIEPQKLDIRNNNIRLHAEQAGELFNRNMHLAKKQRSPNKSIGEAARQQAQSLIQDLIHFAHDALNQGQEVSHVFDTLFAKQQSAST